MRTSLRLARSSTTRGQNRLPLGRRWYQHGRASTFEPSRTSAVLRAETEQRRSHMAPGCGVRKLGSASEPGDLQRDRLYHPTLGPPISLGPSAAFCRLSAVAVSELGIEPPFSTAAPGPQRREGSGTTHDRQASERSTSGRCQRGDGAQAPGSSMRKAKAASRKALKAGVFLKDLNWIVSHGVHLSPKIAADQNSSSGRRLSRLLASRPG
jgi:hypothetical protein